jgi:hypothetical protein
MFRTLSQLAPLGLASAFSIFAAPVAANDVFNGNMAAYVAHLQSKLADEPEIWRALRLSSAAHAGLSEDEILALDETWRQEVALSDRPLISGIYDHAASQVVRDMLETAKGRVTEIIVMDAVGLNVAISAVTSDFWQGDEAKHAQTFGRPSGALHIGEVAFDDSTQRFQIQVSAPLNEPATDTPVGAVTFGLNADMF